MFFNQQKFRSLICENVPDEFNSEERLRVHFSRFGTVQGVVASPRKKLAKVLFQTASDAASAKRNAAIIQDSYPPMKLYYADDNRISRSTTSKTLKPTSNTNRLALSPTSSNKNAAVVFSEDPSGFNVDDFGKPTVTGRTSADAFNTGQHSNLLFDLDPSDRLPAKASRSPVKRFASRSSWDSRRLLSKNSNDSNIVVELNDQNLFANNSQQKSSPSSSEFEDGTTRFKDFRSRNSASFPTQTSARRARSHLLKRALNRPKAKSNSIMGRASGAIEDLNDPETERHPNNVEATKETPSFFGNSPFGANVANRHAVFGGSAQRESAENAETQSRSFGSVFGTTTGKNEKASSSSLKRSFGNATNSSENFALPTKRVSWTGEIPTGPVFGGGLKVEDVESRSTAKKISWLKGRDESLRKAGNDQSQNLKGSARPFSLEIISDVQFCS